MRTQRLELRHPELEDAQALFDAYAADPQVTRYLVWRPHKDATETREFLALRRALSSTGASYCWVIRKLDETSPVGMIELRVSGTQGNVGYVLARSHWGHGIMPEAVVSVVEFARSALSLQIISSCCDLENPASARVLRKAGFDYLGVRKSHFAHPAISHGARDVQFFELRLG